MAIGSNSKLAAAFLVLVGASACRGAADLAAGVTVDGMLSLRPGMTYAEVVATIGEPLIMEAEAHSGSAVGLPPTRDPTHGKVMLTYSRRMNLLTSYPMLWVHLRYGKVSEVYAKQYYALISDDRGIYGYSTGQKPWGQPREALERIFKR
jgi:hypothetical protein